ncbi:MAG: hypothetical protein R3Y06_09710 [Faecalibacterium sp.]
MKKHKHTMNNSTNVLLGMAAGAAVSAAGMYYATHNQKEMKKMAKKISHTAEHAMSGIDNVVSNLTQNF